MNVLKKKWEKNNKNFLQKKLSNNILKEKKIETKNKDIFEINLDINNEKKFPIEIVLIKDNIDEVVNPKINHVNSCENENKSEYIIKLDNIYINREINNSTSNLLNTQINKNQD